MDALRGIAAVLVVLGHARLITMDHTPLPLSPRADLTFAALLPTVFAQEAVAVFFALSGFWVGGSVISALARGSFRWSGYLSRRLVRLYAVLVPGLALTLALDLVRRYGLGDGRRIKALDPLTLLGNLAFLQPRWVAPFGSDDSLWSLSYELWFYLAFPAAMLCVHHLRRRALRAAAVNCGVVAVAALLGSRDWFALWLVWLLGAVTAWACRHWRPSPTFARFLLPPALALLGLSLLLSELWTLADVPRTWLVGAAALPLLACCATWPASGRPGRPLAAASWIGRWSFSLYVFHLPIVLILDDLTRGSTVRNVFTPLYVYGLASVALPICWVLSLVTESRTPQLRKLALRGVARVRGVRRLT